MPQQVALSGVMHPTKHLRVTRIASIQEIESLTADWDRLSQQVPFRRPQWLLTWWKHYGGTRDLYILRVSDPDRRVVAIAPWYRDTAIGRCLRFLGDGKVCSDYLSLLCEPQDAAAVADAIGDWLTEFDQAGHPHGWDCIEWQAIPEQDLAVGYLREHLRQRGFPVSIRRNESVYPLSLPPDFSSYICSRSRSTRHMIRRLMRQLDDGRISLQLIQDRRALTDELWNVFVDLHQLRRRCKGQTGCFDFPPFGDFLREATESLMDAACASLLLAYDGQTPMAACLLFHDSQTTYLYQTGMDHGVTESHPGTVANLLAIRWTIERGARVYDFLRGDEPYKRSWHACPVSTCDLRVTSRRLTPRLRHGILETGQTFKDLLRSGLASIGLHS